jgi:LPPG:FO 2-phospho-L-lactate transferase
VLDAISDPETSAILIAPSNPFLSIDPILAVPGVRDALQSASAPVVAVSPLVGGQAVKGPTAKLMAELGLEVTVEAVARHYGDVIDGILVDERDPPADLAVANMRADTMMRTVEDRVRVAQAALDLAATLTR